MRIDLDHLTDAGLEELEQSISREREFRQRATRHELMTRNVPGRGLHPELVRRVMIDYQTLVDGGCKTPVLSLAQQWDISISRASRWLRTIGLRSIRDPR